MPVAQDAPRLYGSLMPDGLYAEQLDLEAKAVQDSVAAYYETVAKDISHDRGGQMRAVSRLKTHWLSDLISGVESLHQHIESGTAGFGQTIFGPPMKMIDAPRAAMIAIDVVLSMTLAEAHSGAKRFSVSYGIGRAIIAELHRDMIAARRRAYLKDTRKRVREEDRHWTPEEAEGLGELSRLIATHSPKHIIWWSRKNLEDPLFNRNVCLKIGDRLLQEVFYACGLGGDRAFVHEQKIIRNIKPGGDTQLKTVNMVKIAPGALAAVEEAHSFLAPLKPKHLPMVCVPLDWDENGQGGGYLTAQPSIVIRCGSIQKDLMQQRDISKVVAAVNALQNTALRVSPPVFELLDQAFKRGGKVLGMHATVQGKMPPTPSGFDYGQPRGHRWDKVGLEARADWFTEARLQHQENERLAGVRAGYHSALAAARRMLKQSAFFLPRQLDARGRIYPMPRHLNHHKEDCFRALFEFADPKPVDDQGRFWIMQAAAKLYGHKTLTFEERAQWTEDHMPEIREAVERGLESEFLHGAKDPFQFFAMCCAILDPERAARIPVGRDGTCNGAQHFAAFSRDEVSAALVNLMPQERPRSIYHEAQKAAEAIAATDSESPLAEAFREFIDEKMSKTPTMTTYYGVKVIGMRNQISERLKKLGAKREDVFDLSAYGVDVYQEAVRAIAPRLGAVFDWLERMADSAIRAYKRPLQWSSPIGFPIIQDGRRYTKRPCVQIKTCLGSHKVVDPGARPKAMLDAQIRGFAPNFNHGVDAAHSMMIALGCDEEGIAELDIHDDFRTHAQTFERHGEIVRQTFVETHQRPLLHELAEELEQRYPKAKIADPPPQGDFDLRQALDSPYAFS